MTPADFDAAAAVVLSWLLTYAIHSSILLAAAAALAWRLADHHAWLDLIWKTALIAPLLTASLRLDPIARPVAGPWAMPNAIAVSGTPAKAIGTAEPPASSPAGEPSEVVERSRVGVAPVPVAAAPSTAWPPIVRHWRSIAALSWLIVALGSVSVYGARLRRVYRALEAGAPVTADDWLDTGSRSIRLTTNSICPVPLALAGRRIVLPERFFRELDPEQQRAAVAHELAHVDRRDPEWRIAIEVLERALFVQPLNRLARARLCDTAEFLCDERAVQQTQAPLAMARCLSVVASWWSPADELPAGVSAMARSDSAMVRRVTRILNEPARPAGRPRLFWLAIPVALVAVAAPRVTATELPMPLAVTPAAAVVLTAANVEKAAEQRAPLLMQRPARPGDSFEERWRQALADAARQGLTDFWIVYIFNTPTHAGDVVMNDTADGSSFVSSDGRVSTPGPSLISRFKPSAAVPLEGANLAVLLHYRGARADAIDRAGYRSVQLGFDFGRTAVFWLGDATESQSFARVRTLFGEARDRKIQVLLLELASLHSDSNVVIPFLTRLVEPSWPPEIRGEAAEGFEHHHDRRSVEVLLRVARTDTDATVRAEAAEAIGDVQTPESIPALHDLASQSADPEVRREAAEAFAAQPAERALPALERVIATSEDEDVVSEAVEALGEIDVPGAMAALERIARDDDREEIQAEAIETIADRSGQALQPVILELAESGRKGRIRKAALDAIGEAVRESRDPQLLDRAQRAIERAIFDDPDADVRVEALDVLEDLPDDRALRVLRDVIARHPDARVRREAGELLRERQ